MRAPGDDRRVEAHGTPPVAVPREPASANEFVGLGAAGGCLLPGALSTDHVLALQRASGNRAVTRLLQPNAGTGESPSGRGQRADRFATRIIAREPESSTGDPRLATLRREAQRLAGVVDADLMVRQDLHDLNEDQWIVSAIAEVVGGSGDLPTAMLWVPGQEVDRPGQRLPGARERPLGGTGTSAGSRGDRGGAQSPAGVSRSRDLRRRDIHDRAADHGSSGNCGRHGRDRRGGGDRGSRIGGNGGHGRGRRRGLRHHSSEIAVKRLGQAAFAQMNPAQLAAAAEVLGIEVSALTPQMFVSAGRRVIVDFLSGAAVTPLTTATEVTFSSLTGGNVPKSPEAMAQLVLDNAIHGGIVQALVTAVTHGSAAAGMRSGFEPSANRRSGAGKTSAHAAGEPPAVRGVDEVAGSPAHSTDAAVPAESTGTPASESAGAGAAPHPNADVAESPMSRDQELAKLIAEQAADRASGDVGLIDVEPGAANVRDLPEYEGGVATASEIFERLPDIENPKNIASGVEGDPKKSGWGETRSRQPSARWRRA
jgi:hypothetical protein